MRPKIDPTEVFEIHDKCICVSVPKYKLAKIRRLFCPAHRNSRPMYEATLPPTRSICPKAIKGRCGCREDIS